MKTEICQYKNRILQSEQRRIEEVNTNFIRINELEQKLNGEQRRRIEEMDEKERKIELLEGEIEHTIENQLRENQELRDQNMLIQTKLNVMQNLEYQLKAHMGSGGAGEGDGDSMGQMVNKLIVEN